MKPCYGNDFCEPAPASWGNFPRQHGCEQLGVVILWGLQPLIGPLDGLLNVLLNALLNALLSGAARFDWREIAPPTSVWIS